MTRAVAALRRGGVAALTAVLLACLLCFAGVPQQARAAEDVRLPIMGSLGTSSGILPVGLDDTDATYVTIERLASADETLSNSLVTFRGEVVGEAVRATTPGYVWVLMQQNANQTTSSIQVLMSEEHARRIEHFGAYGVKGTTLLVTGIYRVADPNQTGTLDVTAYNVRAVESGGPLEQNVETGRLWVGVGLVCAGLALTVLNSYLKRRSRS